jgi:4-oxalocrotonate tautomerase
MVDQTPIRRSEPRRHPVTEAHWKETEMPLINVKVIEDTFTPAQKETIARTLTEAMVAIEGENMRSVTWCIIDRREGDPALLTVTRRSSLRARPVAPFRHPAVWASAAASAACG